MSSDRSEFSRRQWVGMVSVPAIAGLIGAMPAAGATNDSDSAPMRGARIHNIRDHGAKGDGATVDTAAIQSAIDAAHADQGGIVFVPAHYHVAAQGRKIVRFLHPEDEGLFRALERALAGLPLAEAAVLVADGRLLDTLTGQPFTWQPVPMVFPVSERLRELTAGEEYEARAAAEAGRRAFEVK